MNIVKDIVAFFCGKKHHTFYFQSLTFSDSLFLLRLFILQLFGYEDKVNSRELFLEEVKKSFHFNRAYLFGSARSSLYSILKSLSYANGSEVLVTGFTCEVVPNAVINAGYSPVYVDINPVNYCMNPKIVEKLITKKTKVIIIQHTFGIPAEIDELINIAKKYNLFIVEDCAVSLGSKYNGKLTGTFGDASIFSFELSKTITCCWGGMLLLNTNNSTVVKNMEEFYNKVPEQKKSKLVRVLFQIWLSGILYKPRIYIIGKYLLGFLFKFKIFSPSTSVIEKKGGLSSNYLVRLSNKQAKIINRQYLKLDKLCEKKIIIKNQYLDNFSNILDQNFKKFICKNDVILLRFPMLINNHSLVKEYFDNNYVQLGLWFTAPISSKSVDHNIFKYNVGSCPISEFITENIINISTDYLLNKNLTEVLLNSNIKTKSL